MNKVSAHTPALIIALLLAGTLFAPLILSGHTSAAPLRVVGTASPTTIDATQSVSFACTPSGGTPPYSFSWAFGDSGTSDLQNVSYAYTTAGTYTASVTVTDGVSGVDTWSSPTITVNPLPSVTGMATPTTIDETQSVSFTCTPSSGTSPYTYLWDFGDGSPGSTAQDTSHIYASAGTYTADVTVTDTVGEQAYWSVVITVNGMSSVTGMATPTTIDVNQTVQFTCTTNYGTTPYTYSWAFGDGDTSALQNPSHIYALEGSYTSNVTVTDAVGGQASWTVVITVNALPSVTGTPAPTSIDSGQIVSFMCTPSFGTTPYTYSWDFGSAPGQYVDATTNQSQSPYYEYENSGSSTETYTATVTVTDAVGAQTTWTSSVTVYALPAVTGTASPMIIDSGQIVSFACTANFGSGVYSSYLWVFGDNSTDTSTDRNTTHEYDVAGSYTATVMVTDSLAERAIGTVDVIVNVLPTVTGTASPTAIDAGQIISFSCSPSGGTAPFAYSWTFGDGSTSAIQSPDHTYTAAGTYTVNVTVTDTANLTARWSTVITVSGGATGIPLMTWALMMGAGIAVLIVVLGILAARRSKEKTTASGAAENADALVPPIAVPKEPSPVEQPPVKEAEPVTEAPKEIVKEGPGSSKKAAAAKALANKDAFVPLIAVPKEPKLVEQPPMEKVGPVIESPKQAVKEKPRLPKKTCPLCLDMNDPTARVCKRCGTKLKFQVSRKHVSGKRPYSRK